MFSVGTSLTLVEVFLPTDFLLTETGICGTSSTTSSNSESLDSMTFLFLVFFLVGTFGVTLLQPFLGPTTTLFILVVEILVAAGTTYPELLLNLFSTLKIKNCCAINK
jgi:uncharacterized phage infection (PIP) family protein YhgE